MAPLSLSTTSLGTALDCLKRYEYRYRHHLVAKPPEVSVALRRGIWIHACLEALHKGADWTTQLRQMAEWATAHGVPQEAADNLAYEVIDIITGYQQYWKVKERHPIEPVASEVKFSYTLPNGDVLSATLDTVVGMRGELYIMEHKSTQQFPEANWRTLDPQTALQYLLANLNGYPVVGVIFNYLNTRHAPIPEVTKTQREAPRFYARDITTTSVAFEAGVAELQRVFAERYGTDGPSAWASTKDYVEEQRLKMVRDDEFFLRETIYKPNALVKAVLQDALFAFDLIRMAEEKNWWPRTVRRSDCQRCTYARLCPVEAWRGGVASNLRETLFEVENDDLRSEGRTIGNA